MDPTGPLKPAPGRRQELRSLLLLGTRVAALLLLVVTFGDEIEFSAESSDSNASVGIPEPWGSRFQTSAEGTARFRSAGPDEIFGTADDISGDSNLAKPQ